MITMITLRMMIVGNNTAGLPAILRQMKADGAIHVVEIVFSFLSQRFSFPSVFFLL